MIVDTKVEGWGGGGLSWSDKMQENIRTGGERVCLKVSIVDE